MQKLHYFLLVFSLYWCSCASSTKEAVNDEEAEVYTRAERRTKVLTDSLQLDSFQVNELFELHLRLERSFAELNAQKEKMDKRIFKNEVRKLILFTETQYKRILTNDQYQVYKQYRMRKSKGTKGILRARKSLEHSSDE